MRLSQDRDLKVNRARVHAALQSAPGKLAEIREGQTWRLATPGKQVQECVRTVHYLCSSERANNQAANDSIFGRYD